jgi:hypothetical protein
MVVGAAAASERLHDMQRKGAAMRHFGVMLSEARKQYEKQRSRDRELVCADGFHMDCDVLKLRKAAWTNDDPAKINSPTGGIFFSIWVSQEDARSGRAKYNIHSYAHRKLKSYRIASNDFCNEFRAAFERLRKRWPNVSTDFGCATLMEGWFKIENKTFARDVLKLMNQFEELAAIIDDLLKRRLKLPRRVRAAVA